MKKRIVVGVIAAAFAVFMLSNLVRPTVVFDIVISAIASLAAFEIIKATGVKSNAVLGVGITMAFLIPLYYGLYYKLRFIKNIKILPVIVLYVILLCILLIINYKDINFGKISTIMYGTIFIPWVISIIIQFRDIHFKFKGRYDKSTGLFLILFALFSAWFSDTFAQLTGAKFGKTKLCPNISPKKTVEGAIGGVVGSLIANIVLFLLMNKYSLQHKFIKLWQVIIISLVLSVLSICGDLTASIIKRNCKIKDFGKLMPGHGGIMDRFDSASFTLSTLWAIMILFI
ncbi:MAG: phosphatidate cytidylyltransferase [Candidatus Fimenecus sp.]